MHAGRENGLSAFQIMTFNQRTVALLQLPISSMTSDGILKECDRLEAAFPHISSLFRWTLDYKRFQVEHARGNHGAALAHLKAAIAIAPYNDELIDDYRKLVEKTAGISNLAVIVTSKAAETRALRLADRFDRTDVQYVIVSGDDTPSIAHVRAVQVAAPDCHEAVPRKVAAAFAWVRENIGSNVGVLKVSDDVVLADERQLAVGLQRLADEGGYAGLPVGGLEHDRCLHWGRCLDQELNRRAYGRPVLRPWAAGAAYYLGPRALDKVVLALIRFPGLFEGEYYEDKLIGDVLAIEGEDLATLAGLGDFGLAAAGEESASGKPACGHGLPPSAVAPPRRQLPVLRLSDWSHH